tara:strand:- start:18510 stop:18752 length:243 start_codon:yes stop_codon:yes gene_type:complete
MRLGFKLFQDTGRISSPCVLEDTKILNRRTDDVIVYEGGHYIEMLDNGYFLYRPTGKGYGKRSLDLVTVERHLWECITVK